MPSCGPRDRQQCRALVPGSGGLSRKWRKPSLVQRQAEGDGSSGYVFVILSAAKDLRSQDVRRSFAALRMTGLFKTTPYLHRGRVLDGQLVASGQTVTLPPNTFATRSRGISQSDGLRPDSPPRSRSPWSTGVGSGRPSSRTVSTLGAPRLAPGRRARGDSAPGPRSPGLQPPSTRRHRRVATAQLARNRRPPASPSRVSSRQSRRIERPRVDGSGGGTHREPAPPGRSHTDSAGRRRRSGGRRR